MDWKQRAIDAYERQCEEADLQKVEHKAYRIEQAKEKLIAALQERNIPLPADAEIRVEDHEDDDGGGVLPFVTIDGTEFTFGPNGTGKHGGGLGIVTTCPRCQQRVRGPYIYAESILGRELLNPERVDHLCQTEEEKAEADSPVADVLANDPRLLPVNRITVETLARARELAQNSTHENLSREDIATLIWAEYLYWHDADIDHPASSFALGPVANLTGALVMGRPNSA